MKNKEEVLTGKYLGVPFNIQANVLSTSSQLAKKAANPSEYAPLLHGVHKEII